MYQGRVAIIQRTIPHYRTSFFEKLASCCTGGLHVLAGAPERHEAITSGAGQLLQARFHLLTNLRLCWGGFEIFWQQGVVGALKTIQPDVIVAEANPRIVSTQRAISWAQRSRRPIIGWGLGLMPCWTRPLLRGARKSVVTALLRRFDAAISYSSSGATVYENIGIPRVFVAPNSVSDEGAAYISSILKQDPQFVERWKRDRLGEKRVVLYVGRLTSWKRVDVLIRACAPLRETVQLVIVGDGPERASLLSLAASVLPSAQFTGELHGYDLAYWFGAADVVVLPGKGGLVLQEALSYGKPVIVSGGDGTDVDLVAHNINGVLLGAEAHPPQITDAIVGLFNTPGLLRRMSEAALSRAKQSGVDRMTEVFITAFNEVAGRP